MVGKPAVGKPAVGKPAKKQYWKRGKGHGRGRGRGRGEEFTEAETAANPKEKKEKKPKETSSEWNESKVKAYVESMQQLYRVPPGTRVEVAHANLLKSCFTGPMAPRGILLGVVVHDTFESSARSEHNRVASVVLAVPGKQTIPEGATIEVAEADMESAGERVETTGAGLLSEYPPGVCVASEIDQFETVKIVMAKGYSSNDKTAGWRLLVLPAHVPVSESDPEPVEQPVFTRVPHTPVLCWSHPVNEDFTCVSLASLGCGPLENLNRRTGTNTRKTVLELVRTWTHTLNLWMNTFLSRTSLLKDAEVEFPLGGALGTMCGLIASQIVVHLVGQGASTSDTSATICVAVNQAVYRTMAESVFTHGFWLHPDMLSGKWNVNAALRAVKAAVGGKGFALCPPTFEVASQVGDITEVPVLCKRPDAEAPLEWAPVFLRHRFDWCKHRIVYVEVEATDKFDGFETWEAGNAEPGPQTLDEFFDATDLELRLFETALCIGK